MSTIFTPLLLLPLSPRLWLMRLMSASLLVWPLSSSLILLVDYLEVRAVVLIVTEPAIVVAIGVAEVPPRRLHGDAASRNKF